MEPASPDYMPALPDDVLIVEDDPIIALDFEDTILGFGVKTVRTAASVVRALEMIADRAPDFALLDVGLVREKSFAIAERLDALKIPLFSSRDMAPMSGCRGHSRTSRDCRSPIRPTRCKHC
jgi:CheY-like chemotaxis protein